MSDPYHLSRVSCRMSGSVSVILNLLDGLSCAVSTALARGVGASAAVTGIIPFQWLQTKQTAVTGTHRRHECLRVEPPLQDGDQVAGWQCPVECASAVPGHSVPGAVRVLQTDHEIRELCQAPRRVGRQPQCLPCKRQFDDATQRYQVHARHPFGLAARSQDLQSQAVRGSCGSVDSRAPSARGGGSRRLGGFGRPDVGGKTRGSF